MEQSAHFIIHYLRSLLDPHRSNNGGPCEILVVLRFIATVAQIK